MPTLLENINKELRHAITAFLFSNKKLDGEFVVESIDFHGTSIVKLIKIDHRAFIVDEVWSVEGFNIKLVFMYVDGDHCYIELKAIV